MPPSPPSRRSPRARAAPLTKRPTTPRSSRPTPWLPKLLRQIGAFTATAALLAGAGTLIGLSAWTSAMVILRPNPPRWLARALPYWSKGWGDMPVQSLDDIDAALQAQQRYGGDWITLNTLGDDPTLEGLRLLPVFETRSPCSQDCEAIVELQLYGEHHRESGTLYLQQLHQLSIEGPPESTVLSTVSYGDGEMVGSTYPLPLTNLRPLTADGLTGGWLTLTGKWRSQGSPILYGQLVYIDTQGLQTSSLLNWKSPSGRSPTWYNLDQAGLPELVVNQSVGLEPSFSVYTVNRLTAANLSTRLQEIPLRQLSLPQGTSTDQYRNAVYLAQHGLWSEADRQMSQLKTQLAQQWPEELEQQRQLIALHARFSRSQADRDWSQPSQKLLALLLDGRWEQAMTALNGSDRSFERSALPLLERDSSRLWRRLTASLHINPEQKAARLWGALLLLAKENKVAALAWLTNDEDAPVKKEFEAIAAKVSPKPLAPSTTLAAQATTPAEETAAPQSPKFDGVFGTGRVSAQPAFQSWYPATQSNLSSLAGQQWYVVTLQAGSANRRWEPQPTFTDVTTPETASALLRSLGLGSDSALLLIDPQSGQAVQTVYVKALQQQGKTIQLLASGSPTTPATGDWIVVTPGQWTRPENATAQPLPQLFQTQPNLGDRLAPIFQTHLGYSLETLLTALQQDSGKAALANARWIEVVQNESAEILLTLTPQVIAQAETSFSGQSVIQLITNNQGELLYSNLWNGSSEQLVGWVRSPSGAIALVVTRGDQATLLTWSSHNGWFQ